MAILITKPKKPKKPLGEQAGKATAAGASAVAPVKEKGPGYMGVNARGEDVYGPGGFMKGTHTTPTRKEKRKSDWAKYMENFKSK
jgi:hypothetical protein